MSRNSDRLGINNQPETGEAPPQMFNPLSFTAPTEFVDLPSKGVGYPKDQPLHNKESIEIRYMTAKDEDTLSNQDIVKLSDDGVFTTKLPFSKFNINFRLANGIEESKIAQVLINDTKQFSISDQYKEMILSIEGHSDKAIIEQFVDNMPMADSVHFKMCLKHATPSIDISETLVCKNCSHEQEVQVPFGTDFFWPNA